MKIEWNKHYKFNNSEYGKYSKQAWAAFAWVLIFGNVVMLLLLESYHYGDVGFVIALVVWTFLLGYCIGSANTIESADKYQAEKDKKNDKIPTV